MFTYNEIYEAYLDYHIKYTLRITLYGRYVDDFMMYYGPKELLLKSFNKKFCLGKFRYRNFRR